MIIPYFESDGPKLDTLNNSVLSVEAALAGTLVVNTGLTGLATQTTLATRASESTLSAIDTKLAGSLSVDTGLSGLATQTTLSAIDTKLAGTLVVNTGLSGLATNATLSTTNTSIGATNVTAATSNTGTFSILGFIKRIVAHLFADRNRFGTSFSTMGDNIIVAAPAAGTEICIRRLRIQSSLDVASPGTLVLIKAGAGDTTGDSVRTWAVGSGISEAYGPFDTIRCGSGNPFILNLSAPNAHRVSLYWHVQTVSTGLPI